MTAFEEYLQVDPLCRILTPVVKPAKMVAIVRELATAIEPFPLEEVTEQEIKVSLRDHRPTAPGRPFRDRAALAELEKLKAKLQFSQYDSAMTCFRHFPRALRDRGAGR